MSSPQPTEDIIKNALQKILQQGSEVSAQDVQEFLQISCPDVAMQIKITELLDSIENGNEVNIEASFNKIVTHNKFYLDSEHLRKTVEKSIKELYKSADIEGYISSKTFATIMNKYYDDLKKTFIKYSNNQSAQPEGNLVNDVLVNIDILKGATGNWITACTKNDRIHWYKCQDIVLASALGGMSMGALGFGIFMIATSAAFPPFGGLVLGAAVAYLACSYAFARRAAIRDKLKAPEALQVTAVKNFSKVVEEGFSKLGLNLTTVSLPRRKMY